MSTMALRTAMIPITRRIRAYFAPVDRATGTPAIFDPGKHGAFPLDAPPAPWLDLGWIGEDVFTGYLTQAPAFEYLGWGERGPVYRYNLVAQGDVVLLDRKQIPNSPPFVDRSAGDALRQLTEDLLPGIFDTSAVEDVDTIAHYAPSPQKKWSEHAAEIALRARGVYRSMNGALSLVPVGASVYAVNETDASFSAESLKLQPADGLAVELAETTD